MKKKFKFTGNQNLSYMRKPGKGVYEKKLLPEKRKRKREKRIRLLDALNGDMPYINRIRNSQLKHDRKIFNNYSYKLRDYWISKNFISYDFEEKNILSIPPTFSLIKNFRQSFEILTLAVGMCTKEEEKVIILDFSKCTEVDFSALFPLKIILTDFNEHCSKVQTSFLQRLNIIPKIFTERSKDKKVNSYLANSKMLILDDSDSDEEWAPLHNLGFYKGIKNQSRFVENKKSSGATRVVEYVNECLNAHDFELNPYGKNDLEGIIGEILNNCEDHSPENTWYLSANFFKSSNRENPQDIVGELNVAFLNFGFSIYEGFEETKSSNKDIYDLMEERANHILQKYKTGLEKKDLFSLYALQDGVSRLKFEREDRGTGTVKFINSFLELGDYECTEKNQHPQLSIISGSTCILCDNQFKPQLVNDVYVIALNEENDLKLPPSKDHLKNLPLYFPGTVIGIKVYINKEHLLKKLGDNGNERN